MLYDLPALRPPADLNSGCGSQRNAAETRNSARSANSRAAPSAPALVHGFAAPADHFADYLTVHNTVLLVLPFSRPTVTVIRFPPAPERDCPVTHYAISGDGNGAH